MAGSFGLCEVGSALQCRPVVQHYVNGERIHQFAEAAFVAKGLQKLSILQFLEDLRSDPACNIHSMCGHNLQGQIACLGAIDLNKQVEGANADLRMTALRSRW